MAVSADDFLTRLYADNPGLQDYLASHPNALQRVTAVAGTYATKATGKGTQQYQALANWFTGSNIASGFTSFVPPVDEPPPDPLLEDTTVPTDPMAGILAQQQAQTTSDIRSQLSQFLSDYGLPSSLMGFINDALTKQMSYNEIVLRLRETPEYQQAFPENKLRLANGFDWWNEKQILEYRSQARQITQSTLGISDISNADISNMIANNRSLSEWESTLQTYKNFQRWGPLVQQILSQELGFNVSDERTFAFMAPEVPTPQLDAAFEKALMRGQPALLGLGIRPEEEANLLRQYGISPEQAFQGYQNIVGELPAETRFAAIEGEINRNAGSFPSGNALFADTPFATLFRAIQLGDRRAIETLQQQMAREVARFQAGGAPSQAGGGLLSPEERAAAR